MDKIIICYSFGGHSLRFAKKLQAENGADLIEVKEAQSRSKASAFSKGIKQARRFQSVELADPLPDLSGYSGVTLVFPVWAGCPAPAFNSVMPSLPEGAEVTVYLVSASGKSNDGAKKKIREKLETQGCLFNKITDITGKNAGK